MLSFVGGNEYSEHDYTIGAARIKNFFEPIKGGSLSRDDDLKYLSKKYFIEKTELTDGELIKLEKKLMNTEHFPKLG
jgi:hypothetical protein